MNIGGKDIISAICVNYTAQVWPGSQDVATHTRLKSNIKHALKAPI